MNNNGENHQDIKNDGACLECEKPKTISNNFDELVNKSTFTEDMICDECEFELNYDRHYDYDQEPTREMLLDGEGVSW